MSGRVLRLGCAENHHLWLLPSVSTLEMGQEETEERLLPQPHHAPPSLRKSLGPSALLSLCLTSSAGMIFLLGAVSSSPGHHTLCPASGVCLLDGLSALSVQGWPGSLWVVHRDSGIGNAWPAFMKGFKKETVHTRPEINFDKDIPLPFVYFIISRSKVAPIIVGCCCWRR